MEQRPPGNASPGPAAALRVGLFADSPEQPRWLCAAFAKVAAAECAEIVLVCAGGQRAVAGSRLLRLYDRLDRRLFAPGPDLSAAVDLMSSLPVVPFLPLPDPAAAAGRAAWRAQVLEQRLDVAFALGPVDDSLLDGLARYGTWRYGFGEDLEPDETRAGWREVAESRPVTSSGLVARTGDGNGERIVYRSSARTFQFSIARNRNNMQRKTLEFAARALGQLHRRGDGWFAALPRLGRAPRAAGVAAPGVAEVLPRLCRLGGKIAHRGLEKAFSVDQWYVGYRFGPAERWSGDLSGYTALMPPRDRYWADPFALERAGRHYIFFEEFMFAAGKAHIVAVEVEPGGACGAPVRVLERPYHLSYPFLVEHEGELFMIPESGNNRTVELYRCARFPDDWRLEKVLLRGARFVDATLHREEGGPWWMFVNQGADGAELHDELYLYRADSLLGAWRPHAGNPVKSDVRSARSAGRLYVREGALYRPAQICAPLYGSGLSINRVLRLSDEEYLEQEEERILPERPRGLLGLHTVNRAGTLSVVDAFVRRRLGRERSAEPGRLGAFHRIITQHGDN